MFAASSEIVIDQEIRKHYCTYLYNGGVVLVMEYIKGVTLENYLHRHNIIPMDIITKWAAQLSVTLMTLHLNDVVFMDLTPKNLLVTKNRHNIKLIDFGLARDPRLVRFGQKDSYAGTPYFASPESAHQILTLSPRSRFALPSSDWYSLGIILHLIATRKSLYNYPYIEELSKQQFIFAMKVLFGHITKGIRIEEEDRLGREDLMDFIASITNVDAQMRLGTTPDTYERILDSPLFAHLTTLKDFVRRK